MKIECTEKEKEIILEAFKDANLCPFDNTFGVLCSGSCDACIEKRIEWKIKQLDSAIGDE